MPELSLQRLNFSPEFQLLINCSWVAPAELVRFQLDRIDFQLSRIGDWKRFLSLVDRHRVSVLVDRALAQRRARLPGHVRDRLRAQSFRARCAALIQAREWSRLAYRFSGAGVDLMALKGVPLSQHLYGDPTVRDTRDLDLLIRWDDRADALQLLEELGYRLVFPDYRPTPRQWQAIRAGDRHLELRHPEKRLCLELHWQYEPWIGDRVDELWRHSVAAGGEGASYRKLDDDLLLPFLCSHGAEHSWFRIKWLSDVAALLSRLRPDAWEKAVETTSRCHERRALAQAIWLIHWLYEMPLTEECADFVRAEPWSAWLARKALRAILDLPFSEGLLATFRSLPYRLRLHGSWRDTRALRSLTFSHADFKAFHVPDGIFWLYYPMRPLFWVWRRSHIPTLDRW